MPGQPPARASAFLHRLSRRAFIASAAFLAATLSLVFLDVGGRPLAAAASLAILAGGLHWWAKGKLLATTGTVRLDWAIVTQESRGLAVRGVGIGFMLLGALAAMLGLLLLVFGALT